MLAGMIEIIDVWGSNFGFVFWARKWNANAVSPQWGDNSGVPDYGLNLVPRIGPASIYKTQSGTKDVKVFRQVVGSGLKWVFHSNNVDLNGMSVHS